MNKKPNNITDMPYAKWLEQTLRDISELPIRSMAFVGCLEDNDIYTAYYNANMTDKLLLSGIINQDAMYDSLAANGVVEYEDEEDTDGEEEE